MTIKADAELVDVNIEEGFAEEVDEEEEEARNQLPSVEEAKATIPHKELPSRSARYKKYVIWSVFALAVLALISGIVVAVVAGGGEKQVSETYGEDVRELIMEKGISSREDLDNPDSPQGRALEFFANVDKFPLSIVEDEQRVIERYGLVVYYYALGGEEWLDNLNFLAPEADHCLWNVIRDPTNLEFGCLCHHDLTVKHIYTEYNYLSGTIPSEIGVFKSMISIHSWYNFITGTLPTELAKMTKLKDLFLVHNQLTGEIPSEFGEMTDMERLGLADNMLEGNVPNRLNELTNMAILSLYDNEQLQGDIGLLFHRMSNLMALHLEDNRFTGNIEWIWKLTDLEDIDISNNSVTGSIPTDIFKMANLHKVDLHNNFMTGNIPEITGENTMLQYFSIYENEIIGSIPAEINLLKNLMYLDLSQNQLTGTIPETLNELTQLISLVTAVNDFDQQPLEDMSLGSLSNLEILSMKATKLSGSIPAWVGELTNLEWLDLDANELTGSIPPIIGEKLKNLEFLFLNRNELTGGIPDSFGQLKKLTGLLLDGNELTGNADAICNSDVINIDNLSARFAADCAEDQNGSVKIECECCGTCCNHSDLDCNDQTFTLEINLNYAFTRTVYLSVDIDLDDAPADYGKDTNGAMDGAMDGA